MKRTIIALCLLGLTSAALAANHMSEEEQAVWAVVAASWEAESSEDGSWPGDYMHDSGVSWTDEWPGVRDAESVASWSRFGEQRRQTLNYELFPHRVVVEGDTAVAMYSFVQVVQMGEDYERESSGLVETLVRTDDGWKFLALTGFDH